MRPQTRTQKDRPRLEVVVRPIAELKLNPRNPRRHDKRQIRQIKASIQEFGFVVPALIDRYGNVIAGHGRIMACLELGWTEVPTIMLGHLTEAQAKALTISDNRLCERSTWDDRLLAEQLKELAELDLDFSVEVTGFSTTEIDMRIEGLADLGKAGEDSVDILPSPVTGPPITRLGDLWLLGRHRLLCGSALDAVAYARLLQGELAAMVFTDPPYNTKISGHVSGLGAIQHREFVMASGEMSEDEFTAFLTRTCRLLARHSRVGAISYVCMDWRGLGQLLAAGRDAYDSMVNLCVWSKGSAGMGSFYRSQHELIAVFKNGRGPFRNNIELGRFGRHRTNVWNYPAIGGFARSGGEGNLLALHPTCKPVAMVADAILDCTARGDLVLDAFMGSGTTLIAAERTGRLCFGMELDPIYCDTIVRRWQAYTGDQARHSQSGRSFDEIQALAGGDHG